MNVLKAGSTLSGAGDAHFAKAALELTLDPDKEVRETVSYVYQNGQRGVLNINTRTARCWLAENHRSNSGTGRCERQNTVLPLLAVASSRSPLTQEPALVSSLRTLLEHEPRVNNYAQVLGASAAFPDLMSEPTLRNRVLAAFNDPDNSVQRAAIRIALQRVHDPQETVRHRRSVCQARRFAAHHFD